MPDALSSAPGACGTVSRCPPTSSHGRPGTTSPRVTTRLTEGPAGTGTPYDVTAGVGNRCRSTDQPSPASRSSTQRAARRYAGEVPGRGPIVPARWRTAASAVSTRTWSGSARGAGAVEVGAGAVGLAPGAGEEAGGDVDVGSTGCSGSGSRSS